MATAVPSPQPFRKRLFGYAPGEVDRVVAGLEAERRVMEAELTRLRATPDVSPEVSVHLAALLQSFAETVAEGQRDAESRAAQVIAEAEERAATIEAQARLILDQANASVANSYAEAASRYEEASVARQHATERIGEAVERLAGALAILGEMPENLPHIPSPAPVSELDVEASAEAGEAEAVPPPEATDEAVETSTDAVETDGGHPEDPAPAEQPGGVDIAAVPPPSSGGWTNGWTPEPAVDDAAPATDTHYAA